MADSSERISQLKIDRSAAPQAGRNWLLPTVVLILAGAGILWWLFPAIRAARMPVAQALREL